MEKTSVNVTEDEKAKRTAKKKPHREKVILLATFLITLVVVTAIATPFFVTVEEILDMSPGDVDAPVLEETIDFHYLIPADSPFFDAFVHTNRVNILALGIDDFNLTDVIMLVSFDVDNRFLDIISIPRDTFFLRGSHLSPAENKINAAFRGDPVNSAVAVSQILQNIPINYYVTITFDGVESIIDEIGGVSVYVPFHMRYTSMVENPPLRIDIPAGYQLLDGENAVHFMRFRRGNPGFESFPDADLGRIRSQQQLVRNAIVQSIGPNLLSIIEKAFQEIQSDITVREAIWLGRRLLGIDSENIRTYQLPIRGAELHPDVEAIQEMLREIYMMEPLEEYEDEYDANDDSGDGETNE